MDAHRDIRPSQLAVGRSLDYLIAVLLIVATLALYWRVAGYGSINFDDAGYVVENPHVKAGLPFQSIGWAMTSGAQSNWHPLTWLSYMLDTELFGGIKVGKIHLENAAIHAINAALLFALLVQMTHRRWPSAWVAA